MKADAASATSPWLTVDEAAARAKVSKGVIYAACRSKQLRHARVGGRRDIRIKAEWIDAWLEASANASAPEEIEPVGRWRVGA
jgi:excisionase family DNA binding protein